jgi:L-ascorbate metabolism protein UlaG (beta-lactamase superfamily)
MSATRSAGTTWRSAIASSMAAAVLALAMDHALTAQGTTHALAQEPACQALTPAAAGGPAPKAPDVVVIRWLGTTNYEVAYRGNVFLLDAYYDRVPNNHAIGMAPKDVTKATAVFIGHAHFDHISDAAAIAKQTGAAVVGAASARDVLTASDVPPRQVTVVKGGETLDYPGVTVQAVLGHHNVIASAVPPGHLEKQQAALQAASLVPPLTAAQEQQAAAIRARGSRDPALPREGVIGYLFTFANDFRLMFVDSPGPVTAAQQQVMQKIPSVDVALLPYVNFDAGIPPLVELAKVFKPATIFLGHHDGPGVALWASNYPAALALRDVLPKTRTMDVLYRTPVCFSTTSKAMFIG